MKIHIKPTGTKDILRQETLSVSKGSMVLQRDMDGNMHSINCSNAHRGGATWFSMGSIDPTEIRNYPTQFNSLT